MFSKEIGIISFTEQGKNLQDRITVYSSEKFNCYDKTTPLKQWVSECFANCKAIIFVGAVGIAVRLIATLIKAKDTDPAVLVIDELGSFVIPILSGHIGGANKLALEISEKIGATPVITTATDINSKFAVDVWTSQNGLVIDDKDKIKLISSAVLKSQDVGFYSDFEVQGELPQGLVNDSSGGLKLGICVTFDQSKEVFDTGMQVIPKIITLGIGCKRDTDTELLERFILNKLSENKISIKAVKTLASIELKSDERCILAFSQKYNIPFVTYSAEQLNAVAGEFMGSDFVKKTTGVDNVCERSAVCCSGGNIILPKNAQDGMTLAIAQQDWRCRF